MFIKLIFSLLLSGVIALTTSAQSRAPAVIKSEPEKSGVTKVVQDVSYCELISKPEAYNNKLVRLRATIFSIGGEGNYLYFPD